MSKLLAILVFHGVLSLIFRAALSTMMVIDGVSQWKNPIAHVGDIVVFKHKYGYDLYIFRNRRAFDLCNFTQASLLTRPTSSSYTWHPSRPGFFYFSFSNGSVSLCKQPAVKLAVQVTFSSPPTENVITPLASAPSAAPVPKSNGVISSSPAFPWPFRPHQELSPTLAPTVSSPIMEPSLVPDKGGGIPFISSNPAVPLPNEEVDSTTIQPMLTSGHGKQVVVGRLELQMALLCAMMMMH
ncbi:hypothetical protein SAY87_023701 [Trapa incisa]|uniref:Uncharacterized protein n=1 Tax=Trapa incisa TaxID=236973 RepID=A0AAN7KZ98_9MYRT|nr:hypothetical protein SAY87_023701 [Trapa incisa]